MFILNVVNRIRIVCNWKAGINYSFIMVPGGAVIEELSICLLFYFTGNCVSYEIKTFRAGCARRNSDILFCRELLFCEIKMLREGHTEMELLTGFIVFEDESKRRRQNERQNFWSIAESGT